MNPLKNIFKKIFLLIAFSATVPAYALENGGTELSELLNKFSLQKQSTVDFSEEKYAFFLDEPLTTSGQLQFFSPDKLYKLITKPEKISHKVTGNRLEINSGNGGQTINLNEYPEFSVILRSIISLLSGDLAALKKDFKINFENKSTGWNLSLFPHSSYVSGHVKSIKMSGINNHLLKIIVTEPNNDRTVTYLSNHR